MRTRGILAVLGALALSIVLGGARVHRAEAGIVLASPVGRATVDGVRGPSEWEDALQVDVFTDVPDATFYAMNDGSYLYLALSMPAEELSFDDSFGVRFDNEHDLVLSDGDDEVILRGDSALFDRHYLVGKGYIAIDSAQGSGAADAAGGMAFFELRHPLNSGEFGDIAVAPDDTVGICVIAWRDGFSGSGMTYPLNCNLVSSEQTLYAGLRLSRSDVVGDVSCDGEVNSIDAALVLQRVAGLIDSLPCPENADVNLDGDIDSIDAALILQYGAGLIDSLPV